MAQVRLVSSLADVDAALQGLQITQMNQAGQVQFQLHEEAPLEEAAKIGERTRPGRHGFILVNPELLECKTKTKGVLERSFKNMLAATLQRTDKEMLEVDASISVLKVLVLKNDDEMDQLGPHGPPLNERNRGVQQVIYPHPPFPEDPSFEHGTTPQRVPYQAAYGTQQERDEAAARDRCAQRALWHAKLCILEMRQSILKDKRSEMMSKMTAVFNRIMEEPSHLGVGYADNEFPPLA
ncbi:hypothetical protein VPH35_017682 [Triticum aestivum]|uniref:Uncharacterized protein n=2 Tax=Triticum aestivum TaxID=4565 RepID=A0A3B6A2J9_WHEAT|nr:uncharacterized protein LOC123161734 [Triticum aestivum]